jgi:hypothetical protein
MTWVVRAGRAGGRLFITPISQLATIIVNRRRIVLRVHNYGTEPAPEAPVPAPVHGVSGREPVASQTGVASTLELGQIAQADAERRIATAAVTGSDRGVVEVLRLRQRAMIRVQGIARRVAAHLSDAPR